MFSGIPSSWALEPEYGVRMLSGLWGPYLRKRRP